MGGESSDSVSVDIERIPFGGKDCVLETSKGPISVFVCGDCEKPALITYPDLAPIICRLSNASSSVRTPLVAQQFFASTTLMPRAMTSVSLGAASISTSVPVLSVDELADQIFVIVDFFGERVLGLILVLLNLLYYYGMCGIVKERLLQRYFSKESDVSFKVLSQTLCLHAEGRCDLSGNLRKLKCRTIIFVSDKSPFYCDSLYMISNLDRRSSTLVEVQECGSLVTEEQPHAMLIPIEFFLMGLGIHRQHPPALGVESLSGRYEEF